MITRGKGKRRAASRRANITPMTSESVVAARVGGVSQSVGDIAVVIACRKADGARLAACLDSIVNKQSVRPCVVYVSTQSAQVAAAVNTHMRAACASPLICVVDESARGLGDLFETGACAVQAACTHIPERATLRAVAFTCASSISKPNRLQVTLSKLSYDGTETDTDITPAPAPAPAPTPAPTPAPEYLPLCVVAPEHHRIRMGNVYDSGNFDKHIETPVGGTAWPCWERAVSFGLMCEQYRSTGLRASQGRGSPDACAPLAAGCVKGSVVLAIVHPSSVPEAFHVDTATCTDAVPDCDLSTSSVVTNVAPNRHVPATYMRREHSNTFKWLACIAVALAVAGGGYTAIALSRTISSRARARWSVT